MRHLHSDPLNDLTEKRAFEPRSPGVKRRLWAVAKLAEADITVDASLMPILPLVGDDPAHLDDTIQAIKDHGGSFVLGGGLTMDGTQAERTLAAARRLDPSLEPRWRELYDWPRGVAQLQPTQVLRRPTGGCGSAPKTQFSPLTTTLNCYTVDEELRVAAF